MGEIYPKTLCLTNNYFTYLILDSLALSLLFYAYTHSLRRRFIMWSVYRMTENGWKLEKRGQSFQHACNLYNEMREQEPSENFTINYAY